MKVCKYCGREFVPSVPQRVYCSDRCRRASCDTKYKRRKKKMSPLDWDCAHYVGVRYPVRQATRVQATRTDGQ